MERDDYQHDLVDLGDALDLTRGNSLTGGDDSGGIQRKNVGISDED
ncbi:MAG: benenodin family lasso peptide [Pseudomonadota bacterium]